MEQITMKKSEFRTIAKAVQNKLDQRDSELQAIADKMRSKVDENDPDYFGKLTSLMNEDTGLINQHHKTQILKLIQERGNLNDFLDYVCEFIDANNSADNSSWNFFFEDLLELGLFEPFIKQRLFIDDYENYIHINIT